MNEFLAQARTFSEGLTAGQRLALFGSVVASVLAIVGVLWWSTVESYATIYTGSSETLKPVTTRLADAGIPYRISGDGSQVQVPTSQKGEALMTTADANIVKGMDILGDIDMGTSPNMEKTYRTLALQVELQKTLNSLSKVSSSRVHIVPPNRTSYIGQEKQSSAAVTVNTSGSTLSPREVKGIVRLVAGAVPGLDVQDVTLTDADGRLLHPEPGGEESELGGATTNLVELATKREQQYRENILRGAARFLGSAEDIEVNVQLELQQAQVTRQRKLLDPNSQAVASEEIREERSQETEAAQGVPGAENNLPEQAPAPAGGAQTEINNIITNYENGTIDETEVIPAGEVRRLSAAVAINAEAVKALAERGGKSEDEVRQSLVKFVETSLGYDAKRGDEVTVQFLSFPPLEEAEESGAMSSVGYLVQGYLPSAIALLAVLLFFFMVARPIVSTITSITLPKPEADKEDDELDPADIPANTEDPDLLMERMRHLVDNFEAIDSRDLNRLARMHEDPAAAVLRRWLKAS